MFSQAADNEINEVFTESGKSGKPEKWVALEKVREDLVKSGNLK